MCYGKKFCNMTSDKLIYLDLIILKILINSKLNEFVMTQTEIIDDKACIEGTQK